MKISISILFYVLFYLCSYYCSTRCWFLCRFCGYGYVIRNVYMHRIECQESARQRIQTWWTFWWVMQFGGHCVWEGCNFNRYSLWKNPQPPGRPFGFQETCHPAHDFRTDGSVPIAVGSPLQPPGSSGTKALWASHPFQAGLFCVMCCVSIPPRLAATAKRNLCVTSNFRHTPWSHSSHLPKTIIAL